MGLIVASALEWQDEGECPVCGAAFALPPLVPAVGHTELSCAQCGASWLYLSRATGQAALAKDIATDSRLAPTATALPPVMAMAPAPDAHASPAQITDAPDSAAAVMHDALGDMPDPGMAAPSPPQNSQPDMPFADEPPIPAMGSQAAQDSVPPPPPAFVDPPALDPPAFVDPPAFDPPAFVAPPALDPPALDPPAPVSAPPALAPMPRAADVASETRPAPPSPELINRDPPPPPAPPATVSSRFMPILGSLSGVRRMFHRRKTAPASVTLRCPSCSTHYRVAADEAMAGGRDVRCSRCDHQWRQVSW